MEKIIISIAFAIIGLFLVVSGNDNFTETTGTIMFWSGIVALIVLFIN